MADKKKKNGKRSEEEGFLPVLAEGVKRSLSAVFLLTFSVLFILGFMGQAGVLGGFLDRLGGMALGSGKWIFPFFLFFGGLFLLRRRRHPFSDLLKLGGLLVLFLSLLGLIHLYTTDDLLEAAEEGRGGGFVGFGLSFIAEKAAGSVAGGIILLVLAVSGLILAFNVSLSDWLGRLADRWRAKRQQQDDQVAAQEADLTVPAAEAAPSQPAEAAQPDLWQDGAATSLGPADGTGDNPADNIQNIRFGGEEESEVTVPVPLVAGTAGDGVTDAPTVPKPPKKRFAYQAWQLPPLELVEASDSKKEGDDTQRRAEIIRDTLRYFGIEVELGEVQVGPTLTQYAFRPAPGTPLNKIVARHSDLALALEAPSLRIEAPIPGKSMVGIEVPNKKSSLVRMRNFLEYRARHKDDRSSLTIALGEDVSGGLKFTDLEKLPHLLIAGASGTGKSVCIDSILISLLYQNTPDNLKLILVDPKRVGLALYRGIPHLHTPVIVEAKKVVTALHWSVNEMERRYKLLQDTGSQNIGSYLEKRQHGDTRTVTTPEGRERKEPLENLPYIVIVIDEMADLMMAHGKEADPLVARIAQMARAVGIHLVLATQKPIAEVITPLIKGNITARIAFKTGSLMDSRIILDHNGAEKLIGRGDMLYLSPSSPTPKRFQGVLVSEAEIKAVTSFWRDQKADEENEEEDETAIVPVYNPANVAHLPAPSGAAPLDLDAEPVKIPEESDALYADAKQLVISTGLASTSFIQRRLGMGYARAARVVDLLEENGVVSPQDGAKRRIVLLRPDGSRKDESELAAASEHKDEEEGTV